MTLLRMLLAALVSSLFIGVSLWMVIILPLGFSPNNLSTISSFAFYSALIGFFIIMVLGVPMIMLLKRFNKLTWKNILVYSFIIGFILMSLLLQVWRYDNIFDIIRSSLLYCMLVGVASMITGAIFYKTLLLLDK